MGMSTLKSPRNEIFHTSDSNLSWDENFEDQENISNDEQLSSMVRNSYMIHLKRCLIKNVEKWSEKNENINITPFCEKNISSYAKLLEKRALRSCMLTNIYQKAMVQIISEIKQSTLKRVLHNGFFDTVSNYKESVSDKFVQTDDVFPFSSLEISKVPNQISDKKNSGRQDNFGSYEELLNILMSPTPLPVEAPLMPDVKPNLEECGGNKRKREISITNSIPTQNKHSSLGHVINSQPSEKNTCTNKLDEINNPPGESTCKSKLDERLESFSLLFGDSNDSPITNKSSNDLLSNDSNGINSSTLMNDNFNTTELKNNCDVPLNQNIDKLKRPILPIDWTVELTVQNYNLNLILNNLSPFKRALVEKRFKDLFGNDSNQPSFMSDEEKACCRKRTASFVVGELTPHYIAGKIASRQLFKHLAKKITEKIMRKTFAADIELIQQDVTEVFEKVPQFNSLKDLNLF